MGRRAAGGGALAMAAAGAGVCAATWTPISTGRQITGQVIVNMDEDVEEHPIKTKDSWGETYYNSVLRQAEHCAPEIMQSIEYTFINDP